MSLILDALKKLERERQSGEPGVVVVGHVPWGGGDGRRPLVLAAAAAVLAALLVALGAWWLLRPTTASRPSPSPASAAPLSRGVSAPAVAQPTAAPTAPPTRTALSPPPQASNAASMRPESLPPRELALPEPTTAAPAASPPEEAPPAAPELRLNAITVRDGRPIALINDRLVREGDSFDGVRILRIGESEVEVEVQGQRRVIRF